MNKGKDVLDLLLVLEDKSREIRDVFGDVEFLDNPISILWDIILEKYGFPKDNTVELSNKWGDFETAIKNEKNLFCSDHITWKLFDFGERKISKKTLIKFLEKESSKYKN